MRDKFIPARNNASAIVTRTLAARPLLPVLVARWRPHHMPLSGTALLFSRTWITNACLAMLLFSFTTLLREWDGPSLPPSLPCVSSMLFAFGLPNKNTFEKALLCSTLCIVWLSPLISLPPPFYPPSLIYMPISATSFLLSSLLLYAEQVGEEGDLTQRRRKGS